MELDTLLGERQAAALQSVSRSVWKRWNGRKSPETAHRRPQTRPTERGCEKITPRQQKALAALLTCPTVKAAARAAGLDESTIRRYKQDPAFVAEYKRRCAELLETACIKAKSALPPAIERLNAIVQDDTQQPREQIAAARAVCEYSLRLNEAVDIEQRLRALEERSAEQ